MGLRILFILIALTAVVELLVAARLWADRNEGSFEPEGSRGFFGDAGRDCFLTLRVLGLHPHNVVAPGTRVVVALVVLLPFCAVVYPTPTWLRVLSGVAIAALVIAQVAFLRRIGRRLLPVLFYPLGWIVLVAEPARYGTADARAN